MSNLTVLADWTRNSPYTATYREENRSHDLQNRSGNFVPEPPELVTILEGPDQIVDEKRLKDQFSCAKLIVLILSRIL